ncbi:MAG: LysM peptidoglycan-binding domain-containing protein [Methylococcales bacterium]
MLRLLQILLFYCVVNTPALASLTPNNYQLECGESFDCPAALQRRVHFWIDIFGRYGTDTAVFHDRNSPEKIYSALTRQGACGGRITPRAIEKERTRIKQLLQSIAYKKTKRKRLTRSENQLAVLFNNESPSSIRNASQRIRCQSGNATRFREAMKRFGRYQPQVSSALKEFGLPEGIQYIPFVESAYSPSNYSRVGAAGLWQLMPATARHLRLLVNPVVDERMDPETSTLAAIRYLQHSFEVLAPAARSMNPQASEASIYPFVITSYNFGLSGMLKAMRETGVDFVQVLENYENKSFQMAVKNFYASFLAARHVAKNADQFFELLPEDQPLQTVSVKNNKARSATSIARHFSLTIDALQKLNPALTSAVWKNKQLVPQGFVLRLPRPINGNLNNKIAQLDHLPAGASATNLQQYRVRSGDSACGIAQRFKVNCRKLARNNKLGKKSMVKIGRILNIPGGRVVSTKPVTEIRSRIFNDKIFSTQAIMNAPITKIHLPDKKYKVAIGDTTCEIAENHKISCRELMRVNNISNAAKIVAGKTLTIPGKIKIIVGKTMIANQHAETTNTQVIAAISQSQQPIEPGKQIFSEASNISYLNRFLNRFKFDQQIKNATQKPTVVVQKQVSRLAGESSDSVKTAEETPTILANQDISESSSQQSARNNSSIATIKPETIDYVQMKKILSADEIARAFGSTDDLSVNVNNGKSATAWTIKVATDETLGHYADWLKIGFSKPILKLNKIKSSRSVRLGQTIQLPIKDQATKKLFEEKRIAYHRALQKQYFNQYLVTGKKQYRFQSGDNPWTIASSHQIPLWLLKRFNPGIFENMHDIGNVVVLPVLELQQS